MTGQSQSLTKWTFLSLTLPLAIMVFSISCEPFKTIEEQNSSFTTPSTPTTFKIDHKVIKSISYESKLEKLRYLTGSIPSSVSSKLQDIKYQIGAYNYSTGIAPDYSWNKEKVDIWLNTIQPICESGSFKSRYSFPTKSTSLIQTAYGRIINLDDQSIINDLKAQPLSNTDRGTLLCLIVLSSLEFVSL